MPKVGPAPPLVLLEAGRVEDAEPEAEFAHALKEVRAVSGALDVCYGQGTMTQTELPELPDRPRARRLGEPAPPEPQVPDTEVDAYLVGLDLPPPRTRRARAAARLEESRAAGEEAAGSTAELKA